MKKIYFTLISILISVNSFAQIDTLVLKITKDDFIKTEVTTKKLVMKQNSDGIYIPDSYSYKDVTETVTTLNPEVWDKFLDFVNNRCFDTPWRSSQKRISIVYSKKDYFNHLSLSIFFMKNYPLDYDICWIEDEGIEDETTFYVLSK